MRKKISIVLIFLFFFSVVPLGGLWNNPPPVMAVMPEPYQMGLPTEDRDHIRVHRKLIDGTLMPSDPNVPSDMYDLPDITGNHHPADYRDITPDGRTDATKKPISQFSVIINGQNYPSDKGIDLDAPPTLVTANAADIPNITMSPNMCQPYGSNTMALWDLQYRVVPEPDTPPADIQSYRTGFTLHAMENEAPEQMDSWANNQAYFAQALQEAKTYTDQGKSVFVELYLECADEDSAGNIGYSENGTFCVLKPPGGDNPYPMGNTWYFSSMLLKIEAGSSIDYLTTRQDQAASDWTYEADVDPGGLTLSNSDDTEGYYEEGDTVSIPVRAHNASWSSQKPGASTDMQLLYWNSDQSAITSTAISSMEPGQHQDVTLTYTLPALDEIPTGAISSGYIHLVAQVNRGNDFTETNQTEGNNLMSIWIKADVRTINLAVDSLETGISGYASSGTAYTGTVVFRNDANKDLAGIYLGVQHSGYETSIHDSAGNYFTGPYTIVANSTLSLLFDYHAGDEQSLLIAYINISPYTVVYDEENWSDNKKIKAVSVASTTEGGDGDMEITFQAHRQKSWHDVIGEPRLYREPNTAKLTDIVETTLTPNNKKPVQSIVYWGNDVDHSTVIAPPHPENQSIAQTGWGDPPPSYTRMANWEVTKATLTRPDRSPGWTFGHPFWDGETVTEDMKPSGHTATSKFKEEWAMDGAKLFDVIIQQWIPDAQEYRITSDYKIRVNYGEVYYVPGIDDYEAVVIEGLYKDYDYDGYGDLLINGTGVAPVPVKGQITEFRDAFPQLRTDDPYWDR